MAEVVATVDPSFLPQVVTATVERVFRQRPQRRELARMLESDPSLLTSGLPQVPRLVERLIRTLVARGRRHGAGASELCRVWAPATSHGYVPQRADLRHLVLRHLLRHRRAGPAPASPTPPAPLPSSTTAATSGHTGSSVSTRDGSSQPFASRLTSGSAAISKGPASDIIRQFLSDARAQLTDTTLGPARPHALADFGPHLVTTDAERTCILTSVPVPADDERRTEMHRAARRRQSQGRALVLLTVYALDARSAEAVVYTDHHLARYRADRSGLSR